MAAGRIELAVALHHLGQPRRVIIQRLCQLPHLIVGEARRQRFGIAGAAAIGTQPRCQIRDRLHHLRRRPPAQHQRQHAEHQHRQHQRAVELFATAHAVGHVIGKEEPGIIALAHGQLLPVCRSAHCGQDSRALSNLSAE
ncbi:hypothetical protein G6F59_016025 [Rhizopus arrhizus]|nr:hypothetical protein G6F59_016025 [Rhizopus arrhizus]